jgi:hypothetical protein
MRASFGDWPPFLRLHVEQAATTLSHVVWPPRDLGMRWSKVRSSRSPQYWHWKRSRRNTLKRVKAGWRAGLTYVFSDTTDGRFMAKDGLWTATSYSETMFTRSRNTALIASCQDHSDSG